jgi:cobalamin synthase
MKRGIPFIASIAQFVAAISYISVIRAFLQWRDQAVTGQVLIFILLLAIISQAVVIYIKKKYPNEHAKADEVMNTPKNTYGLIALGVFIVIVVAIVSYAYYTGST